MGKKELQKYTIALAGNPNVGKSSLFNSLTGLRRHTGNWSGKTVDIAAGMLRGGKRQYEFVDLPGTYSLEGSSEEERIAAGYIDSGEADCTVVVCDGSALERNLILALQILNRREKVILCINLIDEARKQGIFVDGEKLSTILGVPVVLTAVPRREGLNELIAQIQKTVAAPPPVLKKWNDPLMDAQSIAAQCVSTDPAQKETWRLTLDRILVSRRKGVPIMLGLLFLIVWLTVWGANYPGMLLERLFDWVYAFLKTNLTILPPWLFGILVDGVYATAARVIAVMLPPMAIFFPLFTILEDVGYLPRMAFLLDRPMCHCGGCGKQALTFCMGIGCNVVGVTGCRIIDSPRERLLGILTNAMIPCNGRFPALILLASLFCKEGWAPLAVAFSVVLGVLGAMGASGLLSRTALRHQSSVFLMEMPPLRKPRVGQILVRSLIDRTYHVAMRALSVAAPAGAVLWILANTPMLGAAIRFLEPVGLLMGMNGILLLAFILSLPANELFIPVILMGITGAGSLQAVVGAESLMATNITAQMAVCAMVFTVFHWPCSTTLLTIYKETGSVSKTAAAFLLPTAIGFILCVLLHGLFCYFG